jgi:hypothetical protein
MASSTPGRRAPGRGQRREAAIEEPGRRDEAEVTTSVPAGGDPACWAHLVCPECGAVETEGHRESCQYAGSDGPPIT